MLTHRVSFLQPDKGSKGIKNSPGTLRKLLIKLHFLRILVIKDSFSLVLAGLCIKGHDWCHPRVFWIVVFKKLHRLLGNASGNAELRSLICRNFPISRNMFIYLWIWPILGFCEVRYQVQETEWQYARLVPALRNLGTWTVLRRNCEQPTTVLCNRVSLVNGEPFQCLTAEIALFFNRRQILC